MTKGDHMRTEDGGDVEFLHERRADTARVITLKTALSVAALCTTLFGGITIFALRALIREEVRTHDQDAHAHYTMSEPFRLHVAREDSAADERRQMLERLLRIEAKVDRLGESVARQEERTPGGRYR